MITYFFAAYFGVLLTQKVSNNHLQYLTGVYFIFVGCFFLWDAYTGTFGGDDKNKNKNTTNQKKPNTLTNPKNK